MIVDDLLGWYQRLPRLLQNDRPCAVIRSKNSDFIVQEELSFELSGEGEHAFFCLEKNGLNTAFVIEKLARRLGLKPYMIGFAGRKDRHAVTRQWISIPAKATSEERVQQILEQEFSGQARIIDAGRHNKKLKRGSIAANHFKLTLRQLSTPLDIHQLEPIRRGVPNYFGYQRFGNEFSNLSRGWQRLEAGKRPREMELSALRGFVFNQILAARIEQGNWLKLLTGDCLLLAGSRSYFCFDGADPDVEARLLAGDIHLSGPLVGDSASACRDLAEQFEQEVLNGHGALVQGLARWLGQSDRRSLRVIPQNLKLQTLDKNVQCLEFSLPAGSYATVVLRELLDFSDAALQKRRPEGQSDENPAQ